MTVRRLSVYTRCLLQLEEDGVKTISSQELADRFNLNSAQVRKDLAYFGEFGVRGIGYYVSGLKAELQKILGLDREWQVALIGYSFGAGILPFALNRLPPAERAEVVQLSLLGLEARAPFEFHVSGWLEQAGLARDADSDAPLVLPELMQVDPALVQCVYGEEERDSLCRAPELAAVEKIHTTGGHHFDGDYAGLAARILAGLERRAAARQAP